MKKNIGHYSFSPGLLLWLQELLIQAARGLSDAELRTGAEELSEGLSSLFSGTTDVLSLSKEGTHRMEYAADAEEHGRRLRAGTLEVDPRARRAVQGGVEVPLTPKEFDILYFLMQNRGEVFTKEQIYEAVWRGDYLMDDSNIMAFIRKLRKKIEPDPDSPIYILTIWGVGYKFSDQL